MVLSGQDQRDSARVSRSERSVPGQPGFMNEDPINVAG